MARIPPKDPDATLDYVWDYSEWLEAGETIDDYTVIVPTELTLVADGEADGVVTAWLSGGLDGAKYTVTCRIETSVGRIDDRSMIIPMDER